MDDAELVEQFEATTLPNLSHRDHVRLVFLYARSGDAVGRIRAGLKAYTAARGTAHYFHETRTWAWAVLIEGAAAGFVGDFDAFWDAHPEFDRRDLLGDFYSEKLLNSDAAHDAVCEPDLATLA